MNPTDTQSQQDTSSSTDATARIGRGDLDRAAELGGTAAKVKRAAGRTMEQAREKAGRLADTGKDAAADKLGGYSDRLRETARSAEEEDPNIAHLANSAADRLQQAAEYVRGADLNRLRQDAAGIAHRHPALFMGGMFALGLALGNVAKASMQSLHEESNDSGNDSNDGADEHYPETNEEAAGEILGSGGASFDAEPRDQSPQL